jgi:hypothetical protein
MFTLFVFFGIIELMMLDIVSFGHVESEKIRQSAYIDFNNLMIWSNNEQHCN